MTKPVSAGRKRPHIKSCFIAAPSQVDLTVVKSVLHERDIEPIVALELPSHTASLLAHLTSAITKADLVLAILPPESQSQNILFEIGCAYALQKQLLIMAPPGAILPFDIQELQYIRADAQNREALSFALDQTLAPKRTSSPKKPSVVKTRALGHKVDPLLARLHDTPRSNTEARLVDIVAQALIESGASIVLEHGPNEHGKDLAVWADELGPWIGNPLLIEIKARAPSNKLLLERLLPQSQASQSRWVLLLYHEGDYEQLRSNIGKMPFVLVLSIEEFLEELRHKSFGDIVIHLRNQWAHPGAR